MSDVKLWRYYLPAGQGQEWAEIVLTSTGMFSAVSDWGNYAYAWRSFGNDFRKFMAEDRPHRDYFIGCLGGPLEYDAEASYATAKKLIDDCLPTHGATFVADEKRILADCSKLETAIWFGVWWSKTQVPEAHAAAQYGRHPWARSFCERILPRLASVLREELAVEKGRGHE